MQDADLTCSRWDHWPPTETEQRAEIERVRALKLGWLPYFNDHGIMKIDLPHRDYDPVFFEGRIAYYQPIVRVEG